MDIGKKLHPSSIQLGWVLTPQWFLAVASPHLLQALAELQWLPSQSPPASLLHTHSQNDHLCHLLTLVLGSHLTLVLTPLLGGSDLRNWTPDSKTSPETHPPPPRERPNPCLTNSFRFFVFPLLPNSLSFDLFLWIYEHSAWLLRKWRKVECWKWWKFEIRDFVILFYFLPLLINKTVWNLHWLVGVCNWLLEHVWLVGWWNERSCI